MVQYVAQATYDSAGATAPSSSYTVPTGVVAADVALVATTWVPGAATDTITYTGTGTATVLLTVRAYTNMIVALHSVTGAKAGESVSFALNTGRFTTGAAVWYRDASVGVVGTDTARSSSVATVVANGYTGRDANSIPVIFATERTTATGTTISSISPGPAARTTFVEGTGNSTCSVAFIDLAPQQSPPTQTITYNSASGNGGAAFIEMRHTPAAATTTAVLNRSTLGLPTSTSIRAAAKTTDTTKVRLAVSTSSSMTSPLYSTARVPDSLGLTGGQDLPLEVTGLSADTVYYWQLELNDALTGAVTATRTLPGTTNASFGFAAGCCNLTGSNVLVFDAIRTMVGANSRAAAFFAHLGDIHYFHSASGGNGTTEANDPAEIATHYEASLGAAKQMALYRAIPLSHSFSDNDFAGSNSDSTATAAATVTTTRRRLLADPALPGTGVYKTWVVGRVRFIQTDSRSFLGAKGSNGAYLGSAQKTWFKNLLSTATERVIVWFNDNNWAGATQNSTALDDWRNYSTERTEISNHIQSVSGLAARLIFVHGDSHSLAFDTGANNPFGGFSMINIGPLNQSSSGHPAVNVYSGGKYPTSDGVASQQFGWFDVVDNGTSVVTTFKGYSVDSATGATTQRMTYTQTVNDSGSTTISWWDGLTSVTATYAGWWDGTSLIPSTFDTIV